VVQVDPRRTKTFANEAAFERWLASHHDTEREVWIRIHKKASGLPSITPAQALDVALCWGWIDGLRKGLDERSFLQRYTPRGSKSTWSQINRDHVARLVAAGRMTPHGQRHVDAAKADGRWAAAYAPLRTVSVDSLPRDLRAAIEASPRARRMLATLNKPNLSTLAVRTNAAKTPAARASRIAALVALLAGGRTPVPNARNPSRYQASATPRAGRRRGRAASRGARAATPRPARPRRAAR
jgi:uncharacterized protein YdeI (YjbR/CyaY-like superfamily)